MRRASRVLAYRAALRALPVGIIACTPNCTRSALCLHAY